MSKKSHPDFVGSVDNLFGKPIKDALLKRSQNGITAVILFVNQNYKLQYLFYPHVHYNVDGQPVSVVGNVERCIIKLRLQIFFHYAADITFVFRFHPRRDMAVPHLMKAEWQQRSCLGFAKWLLASSAADTAAGILSPPILSERSQRST